MSVMKIKMEQREDIRDLKLAHSLLNLEIHVHIFTLRHKIIFSVFLKWPGNQVIYDHEFLEGGKFYIQCVTWSLEHSIQQKKTKKKIF